MSSFSASTTTNNNRKVLEFADWNPKAHKYMAPKVNEKGGKSVTLISTQTSRSLHLNTPLLMTWGISDFANDDGTSDGKFKISINFPNEEYKTEQSEQFLKKITEFQAQIVDDAVNNSELWFGKKKSKELVDDAFFPFLKFPKMKDANGKSTGVVDYNRPPSMSAKVPYYANENKWDCDLFNTDYNQIFPCEDDSVTPQDLVPKLSKIACTLQCTGIWVGGKGWGLTWKFISGVVKPKLSESIRGKCHIRIDDSEMDKMDKAYVDDDMVDAPPAAAVALARSVSIAPPKEPISTVVDDSDEEQEQEQEQEDVVEAEPEPEPEPVVVEVPKVVKKVVKKKVSA